MADRALYLQNVIAVIWDFDKTLTPRYMQEPLFAKYGVDGATFWAEVNALSAHHRALGTKRVSSDTIYLEHILAYVRDGVFGDLTNDVLRQLGGEIGLLPGLPDYFEELRAFVRSRAEWREHNIELEHYVVSTGLREMILGSAIGPVVEDVWACEFVEDAPGPGYLEAAHQTTLDDRTIKRVGYAIDNTTKTRAVFEINKGCNHTGIDVNSFMLPEDRRVPFQNMIYIADGPSDVPVFSVVGSLDGRTFAVYQPEDEAQFRQVNELQRRGRVEAVGPANYTTQSQTAMWLRMAVEEIANRIQTTRDRAFGERIGQAPRHLPEPPAADRSTT